MRALACLMLMLMLMLTACHREEKPERPTAAEAQRLDEAETMLNALANEEGPENAVAPSDPSFNSD